jgi:hypothetical protein
MTLTAPATATGSTLVTVDRHQAGDWEGALARLGRRLPVGWDVSGERSGGVAGYDLILAVPRTLSALAWFLMSAGEDELADPILQAPMTPLPRWRWSSAVRSGPRRPAWLATATTRPASPGRMPIWSMARWPPPTTVWSRLIRAGSPTRPSGTSSAITC